MKPPPPRFSASLGEVVQRSRRLWTPPRLDGHDFTIAGTYYPGSGCFEPGEQSEKTNSVPNLGPC